MTEESKKILIAEDDRALSSALELKLINSGFSVTTAFDGEETAAALKREKFSLILLDLIMPKKDGFAILSEMRASGDETPVVVLSNLGQDEDLRRAKELGARDYFVKANVSIMEVVGYIKKIFNLYAI